jgi:hypothetical protein
VRIKFERDGDKVIASCWPLLSYGHGATQKEAEAELLRDIHDRWQAYSGARLSPLLRIDMLNMRAMLKRREKAKEVK